MSDPTQKQQDEAFQKIWEQMVGVRHAEEADYDKPKEHEDPDNEGKSKARKGKVPPVVAYVRKLGDYLTTKEVAELLDVHPNVLRRMARERVTTAPSKVAPFGKTYIYLYTREDIDVLRDFFKMTYTAVMDRDEFDAWRKSVEEEVDTD